MELVVFIVVCYIASIALCLRLFCQRIDKVVMSGRVCSEYDLGIYTMLTLLPFVNILAAVCLLIRNKP